MLKTRPSELCFDNCKTVETKLKELLDIDKNLTLGDLLKIKVLKIKAKNTIYSWFNNQPGERHTENKPVDKIHHTSTHNL